MSPGEHPAQQQRAKAGAPRRLKTPRKENKRFSSWKPKQQLLTISGSRWVRIPSRDHFRVGDSWHADQLESRPRLHCCDWKWRTQLLQKLLNEEVGRKPDIRIRGDPARDDGILKKQHITWLRVWTVAKTTSFQHQLSRVRMDDLGRLSNFSV